MGSWQPLAARSADAIVASHPNALQMLQDGEVPAIIVRRALHSSHARTITARLLKVVSATSYRPWRRAALIVPRPRWKPSDLPPTQAPVGGMLHWHAQAARSTASTPRMMQCCSSLTQRCSSATE